MTLAPAILLAVAVALLILLARALRIVPEYERVVVGGSPTAGPRRA